MTHTEGIYPMFNLRIRRPALGLAVASMAALVAVAPVAAADSVTQTVTAGTRSASVADLALALSLIHI